MILRARQVLPLSGPPLDDGAVVVAGDEIVAVGRTRDVRAQHSGECRDLGEVVLLPGLINAHCHLDYTDMRGEVPAGENFMDWLARVVELKKQRTESQVVASIHAGIRQLLTSGTTTVVNIAAFPTLIPQVAPTALRIVWCPELIDFNRTSAATGGTRSVASADGSRPRQSVALQTAAEIVNDAVRCVQGSVILSAAKNLRIDCTTDADCEALRCAQGDKPSRDQSITPSLPHSDFRAAGLSPHAPFTATAALYRRAAEVARERNLFLTTHVAESRDEIEMFRNRRGPMFDAFQRFGRDMTDCRGLGPVEMLAELGVLGPHCLAVHANFISESEIRLLAASGTHVVHCPKSHRFFERAPAPLGALLAAGVNVCLGTDSLASNDSLSLFAEMRALADAEPRLRPEQLVALATVNAAKALNCGQKAGKLSSGAWADLVAVPAVAGAANAYESVLAADKPVNFAMIAGKETTAID